MQVSDFMKIMSVDKKIRNGKSHLILLKSIGEAVLTADFSTSLLEEILLEFCKS